MPGPKPRSKQQVVASVLARIDTSGGPDACHPWGGSVTSAGYGQVQARGFSSSPIYVHRLVYELEHGKLRPGLEVRHTCDNPPCANIRHLIEGTHAQNMQDAIERGRFKIGGNYRRFIRGNIA